MRIDGAQLTWKPFEASQPLALTIEEPPGSGIGPRLNTRRSRDGSESPPKTRLVTVRVCSLPHDQSEICDPTCLVRLSRACTRARRRISSRFSTTDGVRRSSHHALPGSASKPETTSHHRPPPSARRSAGSWSSNVACTRTRPHRVEVGGRGRGPGVVGRLGVVPALQQRLRLAGELVPGEVDLEQRGDEGRREGVERVVLDLAHPLGRDPSALGHQVVDPLAAPSGVPVGREEGRDHPGDLLVGRDEVALGRVEGPGQLLEREEALPVPLRLPPRRGQVPGRVPGRRRRPERDEPR